MGFSFFMLAAIHAIDDTTARFNVNLRLNRHFAAAERNT
jgi:hypothetical protein